MGREDGARFRRMLESRGVKAPVYSRSLDAMAAVDVLADIEEMGSRVMSLAQTGKLAAADSAALVDELIECFQDPLNRSAQLARIEMRIKRYNI